MSITDALRGIIPNRNAQAAGSIKQNFIRQFTFVTGKNLLIATIIIIGCTFSILFKNFFSLDVTDLTFITNTNQLTKNSLALFSEASIVWIFRVLVLYLLFDFFILLMYSIGALFAFLKGEY
jgi:hypothetical protein